MCSTKAKTSHGIDITAVAAAAAVISQINGRPVLQPTCNRVCSLERRHSLKKSSPKSHVPPPPPPPPLSTTTPTNTKVKGFSSPPISPKSKSPRLPAIKRGNDPNGLNSSADKALTPRSTTKSATLVRKKKKSIVSEVAPSLESSSSSLNYSYLIVEAPGSIAAARREEATLMQAQRKMRIAHYGRTKSAKLEGKVVPMDPSSTTTTNTITTIAIAGRDDKKCCIITPNSDSIYIAYHDEEWGVPVHDDTMLFELLVLSSAQVGSDWTSILKKRQDFRDAFSGFDAEIVANYTERQITSISSNYGIDLSQVRGVVDNSNRILEIRREFGSFDKYLWGFVNQKPISTQYKSLHKIPVKTSKSESISKDMVRRGFRLVGPTIMHSFMQAAGLTNGHLISCPRHLQCISLASHRSTI